MGDGFRLYKNPSTIMNFINQYLSLGHRSFFKDLAFEDIVETLSNTIDERLVSGKEIYLFHSDSIKFVIAFLLLLDRGARPVCLSNAKIQYNDTSSFIDGEWTENTNLKDSPYKETVYSVLTSGTTGTPKRCDFLLKVAMDNAMAHAKAFDIKKGDEIIQTLPTYHSYGIIAYILTPLVRGIPVNFCAGLIGLKPLAKNKSDKNFILHASPAQARFILAEKYTGDIGSLKKITIGGGALNWGELEALALKLNGCEVFVSYGLTEAGPRVSAGKFTAVLREELNSSKNDYWIGSPIKGVELKLLDTDENEGGHLGISSPYMKVNLSSEELLEDKWYQTRDHVKLINNQIIFLSRDSDLLKYGGLTIYPKDIEDQVRKWREVSDCIILKRFDALYEDIPYLFIEGTVSLMDATSRLEKEIAQAIFIKKIIVMDKFPRQSLDKVDRKKLYELIE